jgi:hypothetical protein
MSQGEALSMMKIRHVSVTDFSRNFARYRKDILSEEVIYVTSRGQTVGAYISANEAERFERLRLRERQSLIVGDLPDAVVEMIETVEFGLEPR